MSEQVKEAYDAFISYRHSDLDMFVAAQIHKELEAFRLPKNLIREKRITEKTRITRVFRDKEELPLTTNLSDPILKALQVSEYLIVICTPRLPQSIWCQREIENFIKFHGRERVLAVLAEGEPEESFPEILCYREKKIIAEDGRERTVRESLEPLAADVRGENKHEVKKRIKQEVVRLAAAMFQCAYDDLRQRHREQRLRKRFQISMGVSAALLAFGCVSCYQAMEIKYQYLENKKAQSEIMAASAREKLDHGERLAAIDYACMALPDNLSKPEYPVNGQAVRTLTEALRVYDNGSELKADAYLEQDADIAYVLPLGENMLMTVDAYDTLTFWDIKEKQCISTCDTAGFYDVYDNKFGKTSEGIFFYLDAQGVHAIEISSGRQLWEVPAEGSGRIAYLKKENQVVAAGKDGIQLLDGESGEVINKTALLEEDSDAYICAMELSADKSYCYVAVEQKGKSILFVVDNNSLQTEKHQLKKIENICNMSLNEAGDTLLVVYRLKEEGEIVGYGSCIAAYDTSDFRVKWTYDTQEYTKNIGWLPDGTVLVRNSNSVVKLEADKGQYIAGESFDNSIQNVYVYQDGRLLILLRDGIVLFQEQDNFSFVNFVDKYQILDDWLEDFLYCDGCYITLNPYEKRLLIYNMEMAEAHQETEYDIETIKETGSEKTEFVSGREACETDKKRAFCDMEKEQIVLEDTDTNQELGSYHCKAKYVKKMCFADGGNLLMIQYEDNSLDIVDMETFTLKKQYDNIKELNEYEDMDENYMVVSSSNKGYVLAKDTLDLIADVEGFLSYDKEKKSFFVSDGHKKVYEVPFYSLEELVKLAEKEL